MPSQFVAEETQTHRDRPERFSLSAPGSKGVVALGDGATVLGVVEEISSSGAAIVFDARTLDLKHGDQFSALSLQVGGVSVDCGPATVARTFTPKDARLRLALMFARPRPDVLERLSPYLRSAPYVVGDLLPEFSRERPRRTHASDQYIDKFYVDPSPDLFAKCRGFRNWTEDMHDRGLFQRLYRVTTTSSMRNRVTVFDSIRRSERTLICYDSNGYLCLHDHPRVIERVQSVVRKVGYGSPSAQLLGGTNRYLRELEAELSDFYGREDTIVFHSGFAANTGTISALIRKKDALLRDQLAHASIHEACRGALAGFNRVFRHNTLASLEKLLKQADQAGCDGKLIVTDGVFSMHGRIAPLPELIELAKRYRARLMIDDAHGLGVLGATGTGIEEHFGIPGRIDVLMGTLSKTIGAVGGYVSGSRELIDYLRFFAPSSMFSTSLPAALCAGMVEALRVLREEPEHHRNLWCNIRQLVPALRAEGFIVPNADSAIVPIFLGADVLAYQFARELFDVGIKCSAVAYPAVRKNESILRLVVTSGHTPEDIVQTVEQLSRIGRKYGILHRDAREVCEIGKRMIKGSAQTEEAVLA